jgi:hypothetical protein
MNQREQRYSHIDTTAQEQYRIISSALQSRQWRWRSKCRWEAFSDHESDSDSDRELESSGEEQTVMPNLTPFLLVFWGRFSIIHNKYAHHSMNLDKGS